MTARTLTGRRGLRRWLGTALAVALVGGGLGIAPAMTTVAAADTAPDAGTPATVTADALPTWQVNGVVWSQVVVGNTVYATGKFATARPPGVAVGGPGEVAVGNLIAYDIRTGTMIPAFNHVLNGQGLVVHATEDGSRLYVGGDFTTVDGQPRGHIAAIDLTTNTLVAGFAPSLDGAVKAITTNGSWVYAGGGFAHAGEVYRLRLAAFSALNGGLSAAWAPSASTSDVRTMVMAPDRSKVVIGGSFLTMSGVTSNGMAAVDPLNGAVLPWNANQVIKDYDKGGITSLTTDGTNVYGSAYAFGAGGTFEGSFSINPARGDLNWVADCLGDVYSAYASTDVVYSVGHAHNCSNIGSFPDTSPRVRWQRALATTKSPSGTITKPDGYGWDFTGQRSPSVLQWYPALEVGSASGQSQAAWSVVGSGDYIALGGEFPIVNNAYQQGLTRFASTKVAPNKAGPRFTVVPATNVPTVATALKPGTVRLSYGSAWDRDNESLTYDVLRDGSTVVDSSTLKTNFWTTPVRAFTDTSVPAGNHTYTVRVKDAFGNSNLTPQSNVVTVAASATRYAAAALADSPSAFWRLDEPSGSTAYDFTGNGNEAAAAAGVTWSGAGGTGDGDAAVQLSGTSTGILASTVSGVAPDTFTEEAWFKTTTTAGGKLIGYGNKTNGSSSSFDRHVYMDNAGRIFFGLYSGGTRTVNSAASYNDGQWHQVAATLSGAGQQLFVDGQLVARNAAITTGQANLVGQWILGGDTIGNWPSAPTSKFFNGSLDDVAIYPTALTGEQLRAHYAASGRTATTVPAPTDDYGSSVVASGPSLFWRLDDATGPQALDASGRNESGAYGGGVTYGQPGAVGGAGTAVGLDGSTGNAGSAFNWTAPQTYSAEVWFKTSSTTGGKLIGFGDKQAGTSTLIDRNLTVLSSGQLRFATGVNGAATIDSAKSYRDAQWHQGVITQGTNGMRLYVDGDLVGSAAATSSQTFAGYWRLGGDKVWTGSASSYLNGSLDEFAVYPTVLTASEVALHYTATGRTGPNVVPTAAFTPAVSQLVASVDASASNDPDGSVAAYAWSFGDGTSGTGITATHTYAAAGTYSVTLTVTDNSGATAAVTKPVTVVAPNQLPTAAFVATTATELTAAVDASGSSDPDGAIASYAWAFGDGTTGTGATTRHTFSAPGTYQVKLTVTDDRGGVTSVAKPVTVTGPLARDAFARTTTGGWGTADVGGAWTLQGAASLFSVGDSRGSMTMSGPGKGASVALGGVSATDTDVQLELSLDKASTGGGQLASVIGRGGFTDGYRTKVRVASTGAVSVMLTRIVSGAETELTNVVLPGVTYVPGTSYSVRMQVWGTGTTNLRAKVWKAGDPEPTSWNTTKTDTTAALQVAGGVGVVSYLSGTATNAPVSLTITNVVARATGN